MSPFQVLELLPFFDTCRACKVHKSETHKIFLFTWTFVYVCSVSSFIKSSLDFSLF